jgi:hypothetical protein
MGRFFNFNIFFKIIFKNNTSKTLFADLTLLAAPARVARMDNVVAPHATARRARHAGTVGLPGLLLPRHTPCRLARQEVLQFNLPTLNHLNKIVFEFQMSQKIDMHVI